MGQDYINLAHAWSQLDEIGSQYMAKSEALIPVA
jgi:hypothetical protein